MKRTADNFAADFAEFWREPDPDKLDELLRPDVVLLQPLRKPVYGLPAARDYFQNLIRLMPGINGIVDSHASTSGRDADVLYVDWTLLLPLGGTIKSVPMIDRFKLIGGLAKERAAYLDAAPLILPMLRHTPVWKWRSMLR